MKSPSVVATRYSKCGLSCVAQYGGNHPVLVFTGTAFIGSATPVRGVSPGDPASLTLTNSPRQQSCIARHQQNLCISPLARILLHAQSPPMDTPEMTSYDPNDLVPLAAAHLVQARQLRQQRPRPVRQRQPLVPPLSSHSPLDSWESVLHRGLLPARPTPLRIFNGPGPLRQGLASHMTVSMTKSILFCCTPCSKTLSGWHGCRQGHRRITPLVVHLLVPEGAGEDERGGVDVSRTAAKNFQHKESDVRARLHVPPWTVPWLRRPLTPIMSDKRRRDW